MIIECIYFGLKSALIPSIIFLALRLFLFKKAKPVSLIIEGAVVGVVVSVYILLGTDVWMSNKYFGQKYDNGIIIGYPCMCFGALITGFSLGILASLLSRKKSLFDQQDIFSSSEDKTLKEWDKIEHEWDQKK